MGDDRAPLERMKGVVRRFLELLDEGRYDELLPLLSERLTYQTIGRPTLVGASELVRYYPRTRTAGMGSHEILDVIAEGRRTAVLLRMKAVLRDGSTTEFGAVDVFSFEGDTIADIRTFIDLPPAPSELTALRKEPTAPDERLPRPGPRRVSGRSPRARSGLPPTRSTGDRHVAADPAPACR